MLQAGSSSQGRHRRRVSWRAAASGTCLPALLGLGRAEPPSSLVGDPSLPLEGGRVRAGLCALGAERRPAAIQAGFGERPLALPLCGGPSLRQELACPDRPKAEAGPDGRHVPSSGRQTCAHQPVEQTRLCGTRRVCWGQMAQGCRQLLGPALQTRGRLPRSPVLRRHVLPAGTRCASREKGELCLHWPPSQSWKTALMQG